LVEIFPALEPLRVSFEGVVAQLRRYQQGTLYYALKIPESVVAGRKLSLALVSSTETLKKDFFLS
jgi:hypothetical protein